MVTAVSSVRPGEVEADVAARALRRIKDYLADIPKARTRSRSWSRDAERH